MSATITDGRAMTQRLDRHRGYSPVISNIARGAAGLFIVIAVWWVIALIVPHRPIDPLPSPAIVAAKLWSAARGSLALDIIASLKEALGGWVVGAVAAIAAGTAVGRIRLVKGLVYPIIEFLRPISNLAWVPVAIVWFGLGYTSKLFVVGIAVFFVVVLYVIRGVGNIDASLSKVADSLGLRGRRRVMVLTIMGSLEDIVTGLRVSLMTGWGSVMIAELVAANTGLGAREIFAQQSYDIPGVMVGMVSFAVIGLALNSAFSLAERQLMPWSVKVRMEDGHGV